ncbi:hypothetical protein ACJQWK_05474 [Exserohilum turcicum]|uniref:DDE-1 domain-containing protein n=1 Tax=Exserohilum turcicum (strain 28A) TaxID=671987 RepID=R0I900_EXST2|nr:uncharacterized protein SETTUDRAFT_98240 [Exserohilum turcica Et28A]EOA81985.1 hypothetical protein SETTUDRAFT_98240 [Exserohilum turcica Et28A]
MLILNGHSSHVSPEFIKYCYSYRIIISIFPPHATHTLQPLDVVLYGPLSAAYSKELSEFIRRSQALLQMQKSNFLRLFWVAYTSTFTTNNILSSFAATRLHPRDPEVVLKRFKTTTSQRDNNLKSREVGDGDSWRTLSRLFDVAVLDRSTAAAKELRQALHSLQVNNELLHVEIDELRGEIATKKQRPKHNRVLNLQQHQEYQSLAVVWSPQAVREARARQAVQHQEEEAEKLQKKREKRDARSHCLV